MTHTNQVLTRILVLSDTHSALPDIANHPELQFSHPFPEADVAIHCGDLTSRGKIYEHERAITLLKSLPAPIKIVIPGNHDMTLDTEYLQKNRYLHGWGRPHSAQDAKDAISLYTNDEAKEAGIVYIVEGTYSIVLANGAKLTLYASAFTPEFCNWGFAYPRCQDRFNDRNGIMPENPVPSFVFGQATHKTSDNQVTVMVTHGPPRGILDKTVRGEDVGCDDLMKAVSRCRPVLHCFGHIHEAWGVDVRRWPDGTKDDANVGIVHPKEVTNNLVPNLGEGTQSVSLVDAGAIEHGKQTVFLNASIMDIRYSPCQWPWLVKLHLPKASQEEMARC